MNARHALAMLDANWLDHLAAMPAEELQRLQRELLSMSRHPSLALNAPARLIAGERMKDVDEEIARRFSAIWGHADNDALSLQMYRITRS
jgi:hypothetical protein